MSKTLLLLGASSELGTALINEVFGKYDNIIAHYNTNLKAFDEFPTDGGLIPVQADLSDAGSTERFIERIENEFGCPEHVVHLPAGRVSYRRFHQSAWENVLADINIQLRSVYMLLSRIIRPMTKLDGARIVFVLTSNTIAPVKYMAEYTVVKSALLGLMRSLAVEYPAVRVNAVSPSMIETKFISELPELAVRQAAAGNPLLRNAVPADIIPAISFLLSDGAGYITGQNIAVTGGGVF